MGVKILSLTGAAREVINPALLKRPGRDLSSFQIDTSKASRSAELIIHYIMAFFQPDYIIGLFSETKPSLTKVSTAPLSNHFDKLRGTSVP
ncbi:hypothetical protein [Desulfosporosinus fructosivorans]